MGYKNFNDQTRSSTGLSASWLWQNHPKPEGTVDHSTVTNFCLGYKNFNDQTRSSTGLSASWLWQNHPKPEGTVDHSTVTNFCLGYKNFNDQTRSSIGLSASWLWQNHPKTEVTADHSTVTHFCLGYKNFNDQTRSNNPKIVDSKIILQIIEANSTNSTKRLSRPPDIHTGKLAFMSYTLTLTLLQPQESVSLVPFVEKLMMGLFGAARRVWVTALHLKPPSKRPWAILVQSVGYTTNTNKLGRLQSSVVCNLQYFHKCIKSR